MIKDIDTFYIQNVNIFNNIKNFQRSKQTLKLIYRNIKRSLLSYKQVKFTLDEGREQNGIECHGE